MPAAAARCRPRNPRRVVRLRDGLDLVLVDVAYTDDSAERYQVLVQWDSAPLSEYGSVATIGAADEPHRLRRAVRPVGRAVPAVTDRLVGHRSVTSRSARSPTSSLPRRRRAAGVRRRTEQHQRGVRASEAILKLFRRVACGVNPDIELNRVLGRAGNPHVARLLGTFEHELRR